MALQAILLGLVGLFVTLEWCLGGTCLISRPIVSGALVGLALGDVKTGVIMGATLELAFIGVVSIGAAVPPDAITGGIIGTAFAITTGEGVKVALALGVPIAALYLIIDNLLTIFVLPMFAHKADKYAAQGNLKGIATMQYVGGFVVKSLPRAFFIGLAFYFGSPVMKSLLDSIPQFVQDGLVIATGLLPALGFAILAQMLLNKKVVVFFLLGFALNVYVKIPVMGVAIFAGILAFVLVQLTNNKKEVACDDEF